MQPLLPEILGWCPDCDGPIYLRAIKTMTGSYEGPCCTLCGPIEEDSLST